MKHETLLNRLFLIALAMATLSFAACSKPAADTAEPSDNEPTAESSDTAKATVPATTAGDTLVDKPKVDGKPAAQLIQIATLHTTDANREFQRNLQIMQALQQQVAQIEARLQEVTDEAEKQELQTLLEQRKAKYVENNKVMIETYGVTMDRQYTLVPEVSHLYVVPTEEELAQAEAQQAETSE